MDGLNSEATSSDASTDETLGAPTATVDIDGAGADAESPSAPSGDKPAVTPLSVVRDVVGRRSSTSPVGTDDESDGDDKPGASKEPKPADDETYSDVPFHNHPRFRSLIGERNSLKPDAERYRNLQGFLDQNAISGEEAARALQMEILRKSDPEEAWKQMKPMVQALLLQIGEVLSPDLRAQVTSGQLTPDAAKLIAKERAKTSQLQGRMTFDQQVAERRQAVEDHQAAADAVKARKDAAGDWELAMRGKDTEFARKETALRKEILFLQHSEGKPNTPEGVKAQLAKAYKSVNADLAASQPRRPAIRPVIGGRASSATQAEPQSVLDIVRASRAAG